MPLESSSSFRRYGHRDERRRRLLTDDLGETTGAVPYRVCGGDAATDGKSQRYGDAEFLQQQLHLFDFIPRRWFTVVLFFIAGAAVIAGLEFAYVWMCRRAAEGNAIVAALDVGAKGSLACWFSSLLMLAAAAASLLVYAIRRHRIDDYQGCYRVWLWAAGIWFLAAADLSASLHEWFQRGMISLSGTTLAGDGSLWWIAVYAILFGAIGSRLFLDMRPSRLSTFYFVTTAMACGLAISARWSWAFSQNTVAAVVFQSSCELAACLLPFLTLCAYARHVLLDAEGLMPVRASKPKKKTLNIAKTDGKKTAGTTEKPKSTFGNTWRKIDPPHPTPQPSHQPAPAAAARPIPVHPAFATASPSVPVVPNSTSSNHKLTKAERKALKERLLRERRERERG